MTAPGRAPDPSVRINEGQKRPGWLPWLIGLILLALLALVLLFVFNDDEEADVVQDDAISRDLDAGVEAPEAEADAGEETNALDDDNPETAPGETTAPGGTAPPGGAGPLVLALPFPDLQAEVGRTVTVETAEVVDVPADEAFTIGSQQDELLVYITEEARAAGGSESAQNVQPGSTVTSLQGTLEPVTDQFLSQLGLQGDESDAVREAGVYLAATAFELAA